MNNVLKIRIKRRPGSAILLALIVVSAILSSALYINVLSIRGMKQSQNVDNSIVAFYAAEAGNEQAIYYIRKVDNFDTSNLVFDPLNPSSNSILTMNSLVSRKVDDDVKNILISLKKDEAYQLDIFDQEDLNARSFINYLKISWDSDCASSRIELTVNEWKAGSSINWEENDQMHISKCIINSPVQIDGSGIPCSDVILDQNMSYQFRFKSLTCDVYNLNIKAFDMTDQQISFKNIYSIESVGEYPVNTSQSNKQALRVNLRKFSPLSSLFDYVLFSEKSLVKDSNAYNEGWFSDELFISTDNLPDAVVNVHYSFTVRAVNGASYIWSLSGAVPPGPGIKIDSSDGILSGTIDSPGIYPLLISVKDGTGASDSKTLFLKVNE